MKMKIQIPEPSSLIFRDGIRHPALHLWDAWSCVHAAEYHLYCLALSRTKPDGDALTAGERNDFPFHIRHFVSTDDGASWRDQGCFMAAGELATEGAERNVWSGSVEALAGDGVLMAFTTITPGDELHPFIQQLGIGGSGDHQHLGWRQQRPISCPVRDHAAIVAAGFYLDPPTSLGHRDGEAGGPIMAWRDPYLFFDPLGQLYLLWSAKAASGEPAVACAGLAMGPDGYQITRILPPILLPDGHDFTQAELPKIYHDATRGDYYLVLATCNRKHEQQPDNEVQKNIRLYRSRSLLGPWEGATATGSVLTADTHLFGMTVLATDFERHRMLCMAPYTEAAGDLSLSFAAPFFIELAR